MIVVRLSVALFALSIAATAVADDARAVRKLRGEVLAQSRDGVVMFVGVECEYCKAARRYFDERNIAYIEYDIDASSGNRRVWQSFKGKGLPLLVVDGQLMHGFSPAAFEARFKVD